MLIIIPARLASSRLPNKVLLDLKGLPMLIRTANIAKQVAKVVIATDSQEVMDVAIKYDYEAILTSSLHQSGSERLAEAACKLELEDDELVINLQADEPFFSVDNLKEFARFAKENKDKYFMASAYFKSKQPGDSNNVKVVCDLNNYAMYFSRSNVPYFRDSKDTNYLHHIGIYAYTKASLLEFISLKSNLEHIEKLEQLRALENGKKILMCELADCGSFGIDSALDYEKALARLELDLL